MAATEVAYGGWEGQIVMEHRDVERNDGQQPWPLKQRRRTSWKHGHGSIGARTRVRSRVPLRKQPTIFPIPRNGTVTFLFTDIAGSTRL